VRDRRTTLDDTQVLFSAASQPKDLWRIPGAAHVDYLDFAGEGYRGRISTFFERAFGGGFAGN